MNSKGPTHEESEKIKVPLNGKNVEEQHKRREGETESHPCSKHHRDQTGTGSQRTKMSQAQQKAEVKSSSQEVRGAWLQEKKVFTAKEIKR